MQVITNVVSVDYLSRPLEVFKEMHRVLKPVSDGCKCQMLFFMLLLCWSWT
jgi:ubiquinone/menaquinone biosynthesis C-methylase UbiE